MRLIERLPFPSLASARFLSAANAIQAQEPVFDDGSGYQHLSRTQKAAIEKHSAAASQLIIVWLRHSQ